MRGLVNTRETLEFVSDLPEPPKNTEGVRVRVYYAALHPTDVDIAKGNYDFFLKLAGVKPGVRTGFEYSGVVEESNGEFKEGDSVFGYTSVINGPKTHQEIVVIDKDHVAPLPGDMTLKQAASFAVGAMTAQHALAVLAAVQKGQRVLINGGSGGVGLFAIQVAKSLEAEVVAVAGEAGQSIMRQLGADRVVNYEQEDIRNLGVTYDAIFDLSNKLRFVEAKRLLNPSGVFIPAEPLGHLKDLVWNFFRGQKIRYLMVDKGTRAALDEISAMYERGELIVPDCATFPVESIDEALATLGNPGVVGRLLLQFA